MRRWGRGEGCDISLLSKTMCDEKQARNKKKKNLAVMDKVIAILVRASITKIDNF